MACQRITLAVSMAVLSSVISVTAQECVSLNNPGFEQDGVAAGSHINQIPSGWTSNVNPNTGAKVISQNSIPWGGPNSGSGRYFAGMQRSGTSLSQVVSLEMGVRYRLSFLAADRIGYGNDEVVSVSFGDQTLLESFHPFPVFTRHQIEFVAQNSVASNLTFLNSFGVDGNNADRTVFIDDVSLCRVDPSCAAVLNPGFELNHNETYNADQYATLDSLQGWQITNNSIFGSVNAVRQGSSAWGGLNSGDGGFFIALQSLMQIQQTVPGLIPGRSYRLSYVAAERPGYSVAERLQTTVIVDGNDDATEIINPFSDFQQHTFDFVAGNTNIIRFEQLTQGDISVFLDSVSVCLIPTTTSTTVGTTTTSPLADLQTMVQEMSTQLAASLVVQSALASSVQRISDAIQQAVNDLPVSQTGNRPRCRGAACVPTVEAVGSQLRFSAPESIQLDTECGVINPCSLLDALNALRDAV